MAELVLVCSDSPGELKVAKGRGSLEWHVSAVGELRIKVSPSTPATRQPG